MLDDTLLIAMKVLFRAFRAYFELMERLFKVRNPEYKRPKIVDVVVRSVLQEENSLSIDERIKKIDAARENLQDAIYAVESLREEANSNRLDLEDALRRIADAEREKHEVGKQLEALKQVAEADTAAFRRVVGLPTKADVWRERLLGFASGIVASIIASVIFVALQSLFART